MWEHLTGGYLNNEITALQEAWVKRGEVQLSKPCKVVTSQKPPGRAGGEHFRLWPCWPHDPLPGPLIPPSPPFTASISTERVAREGGRDDKLRGRYGETLFGDTYISQRPMVWISEWYLPFHAKRRRLWSWAAWGQATCSYFMGAVFLFERKHEARQLLAQWSVTPALFISFITLCLAPSHDFTDITSKSHNHPAKRQHHLHFAEEETEARS